MYEVYLNWKSTQLPGKHESTKDAVGHRPILGEYWRLLNRLKVIFIIVIREKREEVWGWGGGRQVDISAYIDWGERYTYK